MRFTADNVAVLHFLNSDVLVVTVKELTLTLRGFSRRTKNSRNIVLSYRYVFDTKKLSSITLSLLGNGCIGENNP